MVGASFTHFAREVAHNEGMRNPTRPTLPPFPNGTSTVQTELKGAAVKHGPTVGIRRMRKQASPTGNDPRKIQTTAAEKFYG